MPLGTSWLRAGVVASSALAAGLVAWEVPQPYMVSRGSGLSGP